MRKLDEETFQEWKEQIDKIFEMAHYLRLEMSNYYLPDEDNFNEEIDKK